MAEPYQRPVLGAVQRLYRVLRDTMYHTAGTIICLNDDQVDPMLHELVSVAADPALTDAVHEHASMLETLRAEWEAMKAKVAAMEETVRGMSTPATPPPTSAAETPPDAAEWPHQIPQ